MMLPGLQGSTPPGHHIDRNRGLGDIDAQLEQLAMDLGGAPQRVLNTAELPPLVSPIAVLPSRNAGGDPDRQHMMDDFTATTTSQLTLSDRASNGIRAEWDIAR
jgi:hypothetical protein